MITTLNIIAQNSNTKFSYNIESILHTACGFEYKMKFQILSFTLSQFSTLVNTVVNLKFNVETLK